MKQLSLLDDYDRLARRDYKLVEELKDHIKVLKWLRITTDYSEFENKQDIIALFNQMLYWTAFLTWKKSRYLVDKDQWKLDNFLALTKDKSGLSVAVGPSKDTQRERFFNSHKRLKTTVMAYRKVLQEDIGTANRILDYFNTLHNLAE